MNIYINNKSGVPIYEQVYTQIKDSIIKCELHEDDMLPSIRSLAKDLRISVITTKRAYDELEREGFIYTVAGKGCFVAEKNTELLREQKLKEIEDCISKIQCLSMACNLSKTDVEEMINCIWEDEI